MAKYIHLKRQCDTRVGEALKHVILTVVFVTSMRLVVDWCLPPMYHLTHLSTFSINSFWFQSLTLIWSSASSFPHFFESLGEPYKTPLGFLSPSSVHEAGGSGEFGDPGFSVGEGRLSTLALTFKGVVSSFDNSSRSMFQTGPESPGILNGTGTNQFRFDSSSSGGRYKPSSAGYSSLS